MQRRTFAFFLLLLPNLCSVSRAQSNAFGLCGRTNLVAKVQNGQPGGNWPWMGSIGYPSRGKWQHKCGSTLITKKHILTAAHCVVNAITWRVRLGDTDLTQSQDNTHVQEKRFRRIWRHDKYKRDGTSYFDVAVVLLKSAVTFSDKVRPVCLPASASYDLTDLDNNLVYVVGWGQSTGELSSTGVLLYGHMTVYAQSKCNSTHEQYRRYGGTLQLNVEQAVPKGFTPDLMCAAQPVQGATVGTCPGDSGGPILTYDTSNEIFTQVGVIQGGVYTCGVSTTIPGIFVRLNNPEIFNFVHGIVGNDYIGPNGRSGTSRPRVTEGTTSTTRRPFRTRPRTRATTAPPTSRSRDTGFSFENRQGSVTNKSMTIGTRRNVLVTGRVVNGKPEGRVQLVLRNFSDIENATFQGVFRNGVLEGQGELKLYHWDGRHASVSGYFRGNSFLPTGKITFVNDLGDIYMGDFRNGVPASTGNVEYSNGHRYSGSMGWVFGHWIGSYCYPHGYGKIVFRNESWYEGEWYYGKVRGNGTYFNKKEGSTATGTFENGIDGKGWGRIRCPCLAYSFYEGNFHHGKPDGEGRYVYGNGDEYIGKSLRGSKYGYYVVKFANGNSFEGYFRGDQLHGEGTFFYKNGRSEPRTYRNGERVS